MGAREAGRPGVYSVPRKKKKPNADGHGNARAIVVGIYNEV